MNVKELHDKLTELYPRNLSAAWDNDGIMVSGDIGAEIRNVLIALDPSYKTIKYAADNGYDTVVTHHPLLFRPVKSVNEMTLSGKRIVEAMRAGISVLSFHTRLDAACGGVNDALCRKLGFIPTEKFGNDEAAEIGRIITVEAGIKASELARLVRDKLGCRSVRMNRCGMESSSEQTIRRIAVCGGDGKDLIYPAISAGCGAFITGDAGYNMALDAAEEGLVTIEAGHYHTEAPVCEALADTILQLTGIQAKIFDSCGYEII